MDATTKRLLVACEEARDALARFLGTRLYTHDGGWTVGPSYAMSEEDRRYHNHTLSQLKDAIDLARAGGKEPSRGIFVQWKGTEVCADVACECGEHYHLDGEWFLYFVRCKGCGRVYKVPDTLDLIPVEPADVEGISAVRDMDERDGVEA
jgi:hypothetical protein